MVEKYIHFRYCYKILQSTSVECRHYDKLLQATFLHLEGFLVDGFQKVLKGTRASFIDGTKKEFYLWE